MRTLRLTILIALAVMLTVQPVVHSHSLIDGVAPPCSICAFGADFTVHAPPLAAPLAIAYSLPSGAESTASIAPARTTSSRAPPQA